MLIPTALYRLSILGKGDNHTKTGDKNYLSTVCKFDFVFNLCKFAFVLIHISVTGLREKALSSLIGTGSEISHIDCAGV